MSRGSVNEATRALFERVSADADKRGLKVVYACNPDGRGWSFGYAPARPPKAERAGPERRTVSRGVKSAPAAEAAAARSAPRAKATQPRLL